MKIGKTVGLICGVIAVVVGLYYGTTPIFEGLQVVSITEGEAGFSLGVIGAMLGVTFAVWGVIFSSVREHGQQVKL